jgi:D-aminopeptidase
MKGKTAYVVADLEGSTGAWTRAHTLLGTPEWQEARVEVTRDINAVSEALCEKGVKAVVVKDFHRTGYNLIPRYLDRRVTLVSGYFTGPAVGFGNLHGADFAFFVGLHASGGNQDGFLPHTLTSRIGEIRVNGKRICEAELFASVLAPFGVPVVFFSGCPAACREIEERMPWVAVCPVPKDPLVLRDASKKRETISRMRERLREKVREMPDPKDPPLLFMKPPFECEVIFQEEEAARRNRWGFNREGRILRFHASEFLELYENLLKIAYFPKLAYALRRLVIRLTRAAWKIQSLKTRKW